MSDFDVLGMQQSEHKVIVKEVHCPEHSLGLQNTSSEYKKKKKKSSFEMAHHGLWILPETPTVIKNDSVSEKKVFLNKTEVCKTKLFEWC